jgi:hypothetical protein
MNADTITSTRFDATPTAGRKGIAYDWQSVLAADGLAAIEAELATVSIPLDLVAGP